MKILTESTFFKLSFPVIDHDIYLFSQPSFTAYISIPKEKEKEISYGYFLSDFMQGGRKLQDLTSAPAWFSALVERSKVFVYNRNRLPSLFSFEKHT